MKRKAKQNQPQRPLLRLTRQDFFCMRQLQKFYKYCICCSFVKLVLSLLYWCAVVYFRCLLFSSFLSCIKSKNISAKNFQVWFVMSYILVKFPGIDWMLICLIFFQKWQFSLIIGCCRSYWSFRRCNGLTSLTCHSTSLWYITIVQVEWMIINNETTIFFWSLLFSIFSISYSLFWALCVF